MAWSHPSLHTPPTHSVDRARVLKGSTVLAWLRPERGGFVVISPNHMRRIGVASTPAEAMLMAIRDAEAPRS